jgi:hypothetical protein
MLGALAATTLAPTPPRKCLRPIRLDCLLEALLSTATSPFWAPTESGGLGPTRIGRDELRCSAWRALLLVEVAHVSEVLRCTRRWTEDENSGRPAECVESAFGSIAMGELRTEGVSSNDVCHVSPFPRGQINVATVTPRRRRRVAATVVPYGKGPRRCVSRSHIGRRRLVGPSSAGSRTRHLVKRMTTMAVLLWDAHSGVAGANTFLVGRARDDDPYELRLLLEQQRGAAVHGAVADRGEHDDRGVGRDACPRTGHSRHRARLYERRAILRLPWRPGDHDDPVLT